MPSPFQKYQSEQVQQIAPGFVEAYGRAGASIGQGLQQAGSAIASGLVEADKKATEDAKLKGTLAPYLAKDKAKVEAGVKFGSLIKNPDGTVSINPDAANKELIDTQAIDFYNQTGGDINKMHGKDLQRFAASFESKKKIDAMEREAETNKVELDYKRAQTQKLLTDARLAEYEMGITQSAFAGMGFANTPYLPGGNTIPTVPGSPVAPGAVVTPNLSAYTGSGTKLDTNGLPSLDQVIGTDEAWKAKLTQGSVQAPVKATAPSNTVSVAPSPIEKAVIDSANETAVATGNKPEEKLSPALTAGTTAAAAAPKDTTVAPVSGALTTGTTPTPVSAQQAAPAPAQAPEPAPAAPVQKTEPAPIPDVAAISAQVQENVTRLTEKRNALSAERDAKVAAAEIEGKAAKARTRIPGKNTALAAMIESYHNESVNRVRKHYDDQIATVDANIKLEENRLTTAKAAAGAVEAKAKEGRAVASEERAKAAEDRAKVAAEQAKKTAARKEIEDTRGDLAQYPQIGPFVHTGNSMIARGKEPSKYGILGLSDANQRNEVRQLAEGWIKSTDFIINMDDTLAKREELGQDYPARMRLFTKDLNNWATGELQQIFGVATFRKAIVSGGNFSDSDRIFVQRAIAYINSLDPLNDKDVYKAQIDALAKFVDNMYRKGLNGYDMNFSPETLLKKADSLDKEGETEAAAHLRAQAESAKTYMDRFGISYTGKDAFDPAAVESARSVLWNALVQKGKLDDADKEIIVKNPDGSEEKVKLRNSAPKSK